MEPDDTKLTNETFSAVNEENQEAEKQVTGTAVSASQKTEKKFIPTRAHTRTNYKTEINIKIVNKCLCF